jgi:Xaa-Pro aminopeptidase
MVLSNHPYVVDPDERGIGYMANTYIVTEDGGKALSEKSLDLYVVR